MRVLKYLNDPSKIKNWYVIFPYGNRFSILRNKTNTQTSIFSGYDKREYLDEYTQQFQEIYQGVKSFSSQSFAIRWLKNKLKHEKLFKVPMKMHKKYAYYWSTERGTYCLFIQVQE